MSETLPVLTGVLREQRRSLVLWGIALFAVSAFYISFYPSIGDTPAMQEIVDSMPAGVAEALGYDQIGSAAGYIGATVYGLLGPILLLVFGVATGARLVAGEEEAGSLELELAHPVGRTTLVTQRWLAVVLDLLVLVIPVLVATVLLVLVLDLEVAMSNILAMTAGLVLFALAHASVSYAVGAATGKRAVALGAGAVVAVLGYLAHGIGPQLDGGQWLDRISPWGWYLSEQPLRNGWDFGGLSLLAALALVAFPIAVAAFGNRDFGT